MKAIDAALQAQVDAQLLEQGAFAPLELLFESGRLVYADYEAWRRREIALIDDVLMGSTAKIRKELAQAVAYALSIGLQEQPQEFLSWQGEGREPGGQSLRISADRALAQLIGNRYVPAQKAPQRDLFFDNPVVALCSGVTRALGARNLGEAQRQLDRLYAQAPNHADLAAFDRLLEALRHLGAPIEDARNELQFLTDIESVAKRILGTQARDLLAPLWRQLASAPEVASFNPAQPRLHRSFALSQAQDWDGVAVAVLADAGWQQHLPLCLLLARSGFYRRRRSESLLGWCHACWREPDEAARILEGRKQPDAQLTAMWERFAEAEEEACDASDFPAWLLLAEPALALQLPEDPPCGDTGAEQGYRYVHRWVQARRAASEGEELEMRKALQAGHPRLFRWLREFVASAGKAR